MSPFLLVQASKVVIKTMKKTNSKQEEAGPAAAASVTSSGVILSELGNQRTRHHAPATNPDHSNQHFEPSTSTLDQLSEELFNEQSRTPVVETVHVTTEADDAKTFQQVLKMVFRVTE
ncbi:hypothetical protein ElyMa_000492900 [Elysia marginata]|uniref:Uncharacterized protein n=1 Tax=Elysia marginata TaxID=1093978 RepID=A0AAV4FUL5_9GAST|nr:hypothetical protein ElyMa_000492900 [Elysia marginata]